MLPVRVKVRSSSSCSLSQASSLLERFLSDGACCDSLARDYVATAAKALQDSISRRAGESRSSVGAPSSSSHEPSHRRKDLAVEKEIIPVTSSRRKLHGHEKPRLHTSYYEDGNSGSVVDKAPDTVDARTERFHKGHKKKRKHSALENGLEMVSPLMQDPDQSPFGHHEKKKRKKEKGQKAKHYNAIENASDFHRIEEKERVEELPVNAKSFSPEEKKREKKKKKRREKFESD